MRVFKIVRLIIILISISIFCFQMQTSLKKMMSVPTVDTSYSMSIDELDAYPMISVCPKLSPYIGYLFAAGNYMDVEYFLSGIYDCRNNY